MFSNSLARHFAPMFNSKCLLPRLDKLLQKCKFGTFRSKPVPPNDLLLQDFQFFHRLCIILNKNLCFSGKESTFYELDDVRHVAKKDPLDKNISMSEAMTQTDWQMFDRMGGFSDDLAANPPGPGQGTGKYKTLLPFKPGPMPCFLGHT
jgi:hypothetical protein